MRWLHTEYILKGIYLGLLLFAAIQEPDWTAAGQLLLCTLGGLTLALGVAAFAKFREGFRVHGRLPAFLLFLLLESPTLVYAGILLGTAVGAFRLRSPDRVNDLILIWCVGGGALHRVVSC